MPISFRKFCLPRVLLVLTAISVGVVVLLGVMCPAQAVTTAGLARTWKV